VLLELTDDQEFFRETTARFLDEYAPVGVVRGLRDDPSGYAPEYWKRGAELGWTSLLVAEEHGGGTISGRGLLDLTVIAYEFGRRAAPGPLIPTNLVAAALSEATATATAAAVIGGLVSGSTIASWCDEELPVSEQPALTITIDGGDLVLKGVKRPVEAAGDAGHLLVTGSTGDGVTQVLVPADADGVTIERLTSVDLTRRLYLVRFDNVRVSADAVVGQVGGAARQVARLRQVALTLLNAESVGAMDAAFDMTVAWAFDRYTFGRPLASYQALKHRFASMKTWLEASHAISDAAAAAVQDGSPDAEELVSAAKSYIGEYGLELMHECVQLHGGIGLTFEHDLHLYVRRATVNRGLSGTPTEHRRRIAAGMIAEAGLS
jgi:alkylation response protein AidB-like acyl-CoA dehydrogenase